MVKPKVTVLMPVYNASQFLGEAMDSVLKQTFQDFEFLIIDDGSTDDSLDIVKSYNDPRIRLLINDENLGISETLNRGIKEASCDLIARMDADDVCNPFRLQKQYNYMVKHPECALLSTWANVVTPDKKLVRLERYRSKYYYYNITFECWMYHPTIIFRRDPILDVGAYSMRYSEDYDLFWKVSTRYRIACLEEPLVTYRLSPTSLNTVLRKVEYDVANEQNVLRNIRYYMGEDFQISKPCLECLRHNFDPILATRNIKDAAEALLILDSITERIIEKNDINCNEEEIREAHFYKREFIITQLTRQLPAIRKVDLLLRTRAWVIAWTIASQFFRNKVRQVKSILFSFF